MCECFKKCVNALTCFKNVLTCECVNALVSSRNANEISPWGDGNLAFRCATGSGKTLMMHVNIKQYLYYANEHRAKKLNRILILTPNEGLSMRS